MRLTRAGLRAHLLGELLPLWARHGLDRERGGFWNRLRPDRSPVPDGFKRLLVHTRQLYAFSRGVELGAGGWAAAAAGAALEFLTSHFWDARHGGWFATTDLEGRPLERNKELYGQAFAIFALAEHHRVAGNAAALRLSRATWALVREHLRDSKSGGFLEQAAEDWRPLEGPRRQNPHMHLFEALLALHAVAPNEGALEEAGALAQLAGARFSDASGALGELFAADWRPAPGAAGEIVEPGHGFEWFALLQRFAALGGGDEALALARRLFEFAERHGVDGDGGVFDQLDRAGRTREPGKRLWPQTERIKALALQGDLARLDAALAHCGARYVDAGGGWHEQLARDGRVVSEAQNATSVYHVVAALGEALRLEGSG